MSAYRSPFYETCSGDSYEEVAYASHLTAKEYSQESREIPNVKPSKFISDGELNKGLNHWLPRPGDPTAGSNLLRDAIFQPISELLILYGKGEWSLRPRTFSVLRILGCTDVLDSFIREGLMDSALPFTESTLPAFLKGSDLRSKFLRLQHIVLYKEKGVPALEDGGRHLHLAGTGEDYFKAMKVLGHGRYGTVDEVFSRNSGRIYARKRIHRGYSPLVDERLLKQFESEIQALKRLWHPHIVKLKGSYTDPRFFAIIMTPVAQMNLDEYLKDAQVDETLRRRCLRSFSGCLVTALAYLHEQNIRHNDIKPQNILVGNSNVFLSDFGTSRVWNTEDGSTTQGRHEGYTPRYSAPETHETRARNTAADIWSLGCVFLEMATVLQRHSISDMITYFEDNGTMRIDAFWANLPAARLWTSKLSQGATGFDANFLDLVLQMLQHNSAERPTAAQIRGRLIDNCGSGGYICPYCASTEGLSQTQNPSTLAKVRNDSNVGDDDIKLPDIEDTLPVSAITLNLPEREALKSTYPVGISDTPAPEVPRTTGQQVEGSNGTHPGGTSVYSPAQPAKVRFTGLPESLRPMPTEYRQQILDDSHSFIRPEPILPPHFRQKDSAPLPAATLVPSYVLAGANHFTKDELSMTARSNPRESNLFVCGRLMFPSVLNAFATASTKGVYHPELRRRLHPSSADWGKADLSIKNASEIMTPAVLRGYDCWRPQGLNCSVLQDARLTDKILKRREDRGLGSLTGEPSGEVVGFLVLGIRSEALRFCDLVFGGGEGTLRSMKTRRQQEKDRRKIREMRGFIDNIADDESSDCASEDSQDERLELLQRQAVEVEVETSDGSTQFITAQTYIWSDGIHDLYNLWEPDRFLRSKHMHSILGQVSTTSLASWVAQEQTLASIMNISFAFVGDFFCGPILAGNIQEVAILLRNRFDANAPCRIYGRPLQAAIVNGREDIVRLLLDNGARINDTSDSGQYGTPLIAAAYSSKKSISKLLLHRGADIYQGDNIHVNALYQAVAHSDYAMTEMFLEHGAWLCKEWREIRDLATELHDSEIRNLLDEYDVRKLHMKFLQDNDNANGDADTVYDDDVDVRLVRSRDNESEPRYKAVTWENVSTSKVGVAVICKIATASRMSGSWKGRRGVAVVLAALNAGAPKDLLRVLRRVVNPMKRLVELLQDQDIQREDCKAGSSIPKITSREEGENEERPSPKAYRTARHSRSRDITDSASASKGNGNVALGGRGVPACPRRSSPPTNRRRKKENNEYSRGDTDAPTLGVPSFHIHGTASGRSSRGERSRGSKQRDIQN